MKSRKLLVKTFATNSKIGRKPTMRTLLLVVAVSLLAGTAFAQDTPKFEASLKGPRYFSTPTRFGPTWSLKNKHTVNTDNTLRVGPQYG